MTADQDGSHPPQRLGLLLAWHGAVTQTRMKRALGAAGLTPRHAMTLMHLEGGPISQRALADRLEVDPSVLVGVLNDLEGEGLAERRRDPADRRRHNVAITPAGEAALTKTNAALDEVEDGMFAGLSAQERDHLRALLDRVNASAEDFACDE
ncbi:MULTISPECIES: MarR family winged helix-turn-helix transcriptional regulator [Streptomyces]|uniref:MarR family winged helix-turn-helix transcriptional regulator n=1 Tax=Streptomyces yangpuensis TaxID=1648182 RepID=A0ABY5PUD2_9ACTN|nr:MULTISPECIES: MarR family winged helix-turn-helix transcriptional regulator [Streptomyces]UUY47757.1 MarR family winged helix-turn-helix transcriptional regulator [Streptomyces yangpuensis]